MKKVLIDNNVTEFYKKQLESVSDEYVFTYDRNDTDIEIIVGDCQPSECKNYPKLKLILSTWVGYDAFIKKGVLPDNCIFCNAVDAHTEEVAEHMFATLLSMEKRLHSYRDNQSNLKWHDEGGVKSIRDLTVVVLGLGNIGKYLAQLCKDLGMHVIGVKRDISVKPSCVDELYTLDNLDEILPRVDAVLNVLPSTPLTKHLFTIDKFKLMKEDALLINGGRGDLIDTNVLIEVLEKKIIRGIGQDVFEKEPIPEDSKLWKLDNLVITPHVAGFFHLEKDRKKWIEICQENLRRYINNEKLINVVEEREK